MNLKDEYKTEFEDWIKHKCIARMPKVKATKKKLAAFWSAKVVECEDSGESY